MEEDGEIKFTPDPNAARQCFVCEKWTEAHMFVGVVPEVGKEITHLILCMECVSYGIKGIVVQGRKAFVAE